MLVPSDCHDYRSLVERHAPLGFARHFGLSELLVERNTQFHEQKLVSEGLEPMPTLALGEYTREDHRFRWADNELVRSLHDLARANEGFALLLQGAFDPDHLPPVEFGAACSALFPNATFLQLVKASGFLLLLVFDAPVNLPELSLDATLATLRETARHCSDPSWLPELVSELGFEYTDSGCLRGDESFTARFQEGRLILGYAKTRTRLRTSAPPGLAELLETGVAAFGRKDLDAAYQTLNEAVALDPQSYKANLYLGRIELERENFPKAQLRLQLAASLEPARTFALAQLAVCYDRSNQKNLALRARRKALSIDPDDSYSLAHLGILLGQAGHIDEGIETLEAAVQLDVERAYPVRELAALYLKAGRIGEGTAAYEHALTLEPTHAGTQAQLRRLKA